MDKKQSGDQYPLKNNGANPEKLYEYRNNKNLKMENSKFEITNQSIFIPAVYNPATGKILVKSSLNEDGFISNDSFEK